MYLDSVTTTRTAWLSRGVGDRQFRKSCDDRITTIDNVVPCDRVDPHPPSDFLRALLNASAEEHYSSGKSH